MSVSTSTIPDSFWNSASWTVSTWVNFAQVNKGLDTAIIGHGNASGSNGLHLGERGGYAYFGLFSNAVGGSLYSLSSNTWYNLTYTFNFSTKLKSIFVNAAPDSTGGTVGYGGTGSNTQIGQYSWNTGYKMFGQIASVSFYNRTLTATEISLNYNNTKGRFLN